MTRRKRTVLVLALVLVAAALLAFFIGGGGGTSGDATELRASAGGSDGSSGGDGAASSRVFEPFAKAGVYSYVVCAGEGSTQEGCLGEYEFAGNLEFNVTDVTEDSATVNLSYDVIIEGGRHGGSITAGGPRETLWIQLANFPGGSAVALGFQPMLAAQGRELQVGSEWSSAGGRGSPPVTFRVTGTDSYAGVECFLASTEGSETITQASCLSPEHGMVVASRYRSTALDFDAIRIELQGYASPETIERVSNSN